MRTGLWRVALVAAVLAPLACGGPPEAAAPAGGVALGPAAPGDPASPDLDRRLASHSSMQSVRWPSEVVAVASSGDRLLVLTADGFRVASLSDRSGLSPALDAAFAPEAGIRDAVAMDATNGLSVYVAEADRVVQVSETGLRVQAFDVEAIDRPVVGAPEARSPGEVAGVAAGPGGVVFVSEATRNVIQVWEGGAVTDVLGGVGQPRSLAVSGRRLFAVDEASGAVRVLDTSGVPLAMWDAADLGGAISVASAGDEILVLGREGAALTQRDGTRLWRVGIESEEPLVDAAIHRGWLVAATRRGITLLGRVPPEAP